jgi:aquaporin NIP
MNLVRTLGPAIAANNFKAIWVYVTAPITGALTGALCYTLVRIEGDGPRPVASFRRSASTI